MSLYLDLTQFLVNPIRTGIQRIEGELCRCLPPSSVIPVRLENGDYRALPPKLIQVIARHFREEKNGCEREIRELSRVETTKQSKIAESDIVLIPEVFVARDRVAFFTQMPEPEFRKCRFIVYDLLALTNPEFFPQNFVADLAGYFHVIRRAASCGFISAETRKSYYGRLRRTEPAKGAILPLGADSLGPRNALPPLNRPLTFTVLGTIEPRKNHNLILQAFEPLAREMEGLTLVFIGKMGWVEPELAARIHALHSEGTWFRFCSEPDDGVIRQQIEESRATIYVSSAEGYGLPPVESLWLGTPVIATTANPSINSLGSRGVHYVDPLTPVNLRSAILAFINDDYANRRIEETKQLSLPTWQLFADRVFRWCENGGVTG